MAVFVAMDIAHQSPLGKVVQGETAQSVRILFHRLSDLLTSCPIARPAKNLPASIISLLCAPVCSAPPSKKVAAPKVTVKAFSVPEATEDR